MHAIRKDLEQLHGQLENGAIQRAYRALLSFMMGLRTRLKNKHPDFSVSALYQGYMDMTYFAISPPSLKRRDLKIAIVFNYEAFRFEAWLAGRNRGVNRQYRELLKDRKSPPYRFVAPAKGVDSIVECDLARGFDLDDPDTLTKTIETGAAAFIEDIEGFLSESAGLGNETKKPKSIA